MIAPLDRIRFSLLAPGGGCRGLSTALAATLLLGIIACSRQPDVEDDPAPPTAAAIPDAEFVALRNRGAALMGRFEYAEAVEVYAKLADDPQADADVLVDLAIATLNRQEPGDTQTALAILEGVLRDDDEHLRARYCAGLLMIYERRTEEAIEHLRYVTAADPRDGYAACWLGQCLLAGGEAEAAEKEYRRAVEVDAYLRSGYYGLAQSMQRQGKRDEAKVMLDAFERLKDNPQARLADIKYLWMGPKAEVTPRVASGTDDASPVPPALRPAGAIFAAPVALPLVAPLDEAWQWSPAAAATAKVGDEKASSATVVRPSLTACDINQDGRLDLFVAAGIVRDEKTANGQTANGVLLAEGDALRIDAEHPLAGVSDVRAALWGDFDNDGRVDVYFCRRGPNQLWRQDADGKWTDVSAATHTDNGNADTVDGSMFDADHDGDLDLFLVNADAPNELLSNNLDGTFRKLGESQGIAGNGRPSRQVLAVDVDNDRDLDLIVLHEEPPHDVFVNDRLWNYRAVPWPLFQASDARAALAADVDADGRMQIFAVDAQNVLAWRAGLDGVSVDQMNGLLNPAAPAGEAFDVDATGWRQLAVADLTGEGSLSLICRHGSSAYVLPTTPIYAEPLQDLTGLAECWSLCNFDVAAGPAIVDLPPGQPPRIWRPGPGRFPFVGLSLSGRDKKADQMRSNASGIGARLAVRTGRHWTAVDTLRSSSTPGQSLQPLAIGTRGAKQIDFVNVTWSDGVFQTEMDLAAGALHRIEETQRQLSSCPVLFAWNGTEFAFVTDILGVGGMGFNLGRGDYATPRPWENLLLGEETLRPRDGRYAVKLGEPMEEVCYLDAVRLVTYDLPPGWAMTIDERFGEQPPLPTGNPIFYRRWLAPARATGASGDDVTELVRHADHRAAAPGEPDRRFLGLTAPHQLTLEFAEPLDEIEGDGVLLLDGWIEYPYSQTTFAAWQAGAAFESATLEARGEDGRWHVLHERFGYPAGMPRQMAVLIDRSRLPRGANALRIGANVEVYWDAARVAITEPCDDVRRTELPLAAARLNSVGFPRRTTHGQRRPHYDYARRSPVWDTRHAAGLYTTFGPVEPLLAEVDDALAIFGPGEETHVEFAANEPPLADGWTRRHVLESHGWCKDMDIFTRDGQTVEPLPRRDVGSPPSERTRQLHERFNTRRH